MTQIEQIYFDIGLQTTDNSRTIPNVASQLFNSPIIK